ncbi:ABC transporter ATP-binding protein [Halomicrococcus sp. SG-WS-1]|uniref:ABC transporter ATP-binding protein n=1 Tax=Halomicrococcus sp. SG-WS-1 TaxID=3439057 RepID=UPI003F791D4E
MSLDVEVSATFTAEGAERFDVRADLRVPAGETLAVLGPSGSGKTLLLETVAGFHDHDGTVRLAGRELSGLAPEERDLGFVFQDYALFPHLTVRENVAFGRRYHDDTRDPAGLLDALGVADLADRYPPTLSGGERQRVALARALLVRPDAFLLDEPLSALDVPTRQSLREDLADVLADETAVYVTHDRTTARMLADRIAVIDDGDIVQVDSPDAIFERPASPFVARFTGANCLELEDGRLPGTPVTADGEHLAVRPEYVELDPSDPDFRARVERVFPEDGRRRVALSVGGRRFDAYADGAVASRERPTPDGNDPTVAAGDSLAVGDEVGVAFRDGRTHAIR